ARRTSTWSNRNRAALLIVKRCGPWGAGNSNRRYVTGGLSRSVFATPSSSRSSNSEKTRKQKNGRKAVFLFFTHAWGRCCTPGGIPRFAASPSLRIHRVQNAGFVDEAGLITLPAAAAWALRIHEWRQSVRRARRARQVPVLPA